jgi:hypothetical protein|tara:strand:- start:2160 stop:3080 length:921 start_codon:yes stop_codon:yes gene_type:complete
MAFQNLCPPALIYLLFSITQVVIDTVKGLYNTALVKVWVAFVFTILLNYLCQLGLGIISWLIVFIPFLLMTLVVAILLLMFGLDPSTGKLKVTDPNKPTDHDHHKHDLTHDGDHGHHPPAARDDKEIKKKEHPIMKYYKSMKPGIGGGGSGGGSTSSIPEKETPKQKSDRILSKSLLFYTETESDAPKNKLSLDTKVDYPNNKLDTKKYELYVNTVTSILSGMGESEIASDLQIKSNACINSAKKMDKSSAERSITECFDSLMVAIYNQFDPVKAELLKRNIRETICRDNEPDISCKKRLEDNWWN